MIRRSPVKRSTKPIPRVNVARQKRERPRKYGPKGYVRFVKSLPCAFCGVEGFSETAHNGSGGMGYKKSWKDTMPLCGPRKLSSGNWFEGCHARFDRHELAGFDSGMAVVGTQLAWRQVCEAEGE